MTQVSVEGMLSLSMATELALALDSVSLVMHDLLMPTATFVLVPTLYCPVCLAF